MSWKPAGFRELEGGELRRAIRAFRPALGGLWWRVGGAFLLSLLVTALELLKPWPLKVLFDGVLLPQGQGGGAGFAGLSKEQTVGAAALAVLVISVLLALLSVWATTAAAGVGRRVTTRIRKQVFEHLHRLSFPFHQSSRTGDLLVRLMGDVNTVRDVLFGSWINLMGRGLTFVGTGVVMFLIDPFLGLIALAPLPVWLTRTRRSSRRLTAETRKQRRREGDAASFAAESLRQIRVVKAYAAEDRTTHAFARESRAGERSGLRAAKIAARMGATTEVLTGLGLALVMFTGTAMALAERITPGELLVFLSYARTLFKPLRGVSKEGIRLSKATACAGRLLEILDLPPEDSLAGDPAPRFRGDVRFDGVWVTHPGGVEALRGLSMRIPAGSLAMIAGPNGSGKSTALATLLRLVVPDEGIVTIDDVVVDCYRIDSFRGRFAYVPQDLQLFGGTVRENILYGRPEATEPEVEAAAASALLTDVVARLPEGLETTVGEAGSTLSGGEARRVMLARAALRHADVLLLDEPLAGLDPQARATVAAAIRRIAAGRTTIVVSHGHTGELEPDVVVRMQGGVVVEEEHGGVRAPAQGPAPLEEVGGPR